jgi:malate dehydrogenase
VTRVAVVGAGMVGASTAARIAQARLCDHVALIDVAGDLARAMALDIGSSLPLLGSDTTVSGGETYDQARGAEIVVITAGRPRQPGQSRADLLEGNGRIVAEVCRQLRSAAPEAVVIVVTNPLDEMTTLAQDALGFPPERVVGMAGLLDTARFRHFLAERAGAPASTVEALTLGSHGDTMVPLSRTATIGGRPAREVLGAPTLEEVVQRTRDGGAEVVRLLQRGSAYWAPSAAILALEPRGDAVRRTLLQSGICRHFVEAHFNTSMVSTCGARPALRSTTSTSPTWRATASTWARAGTAKGGRATCTCRTAVARAVAGWEWQSPRVVVCWSSERRSHRSE